MKNFIQNSELISSSRQPSQEELSRLAQEGVHTIINLAVPDHPESIQHEGDIVAHLGMRC